MAAGEVIAAKLRPHRPGIAPALGLRAGSDGAFIVSQTDLPLEISSHDASHRVA